MSTTLCMGCSAHIQTESVYFPLCRDCHEDMRVQVEEPEVPEGESAE